MLLKNYQAYVHAKDNVTHLDVELTFDNKKTIKMCDCSAYMGGMDSFGGVAQFAGAVREDLRNMDDHEVPIVVKRDKLDGSIDIFRAKDNVLLFSMECEHIEGADWVPEYDSTEG